MATEPNLTPEIILKALQRNFNGVTRKAFQEIVIFFFQCINGEMQGTEGQRQRDREREVKRDIERDRDRGKERHRVSGGEFISHNCLFTLFSYK